MKKIVCICAAVLLGMMSASAQKVTWKSSVEHVKGDTYRVVLEATIPNGYHMYDMGPYTGGPNATTFVSKSSKGALLTGKMEQQTKPHRAYDDIYGMEIGSFYGKAKFAQNVRLLTDTATVTVNIEWMICNDSSCAPPDEIEIVVPLKKIKK